MYGDMIVVFGGECRNKKTFSENEGYDLSSNEWKALEPAKGRHGFGAATVEPCILCGRRERMRQP